MPQVPLRTVCPPIRVALGYWRPLLAKLGSRLHRELAAAIERTEIFFRSEACGGGETPDLSGGTGAAAGAHTRARGAAAASTKSNFHVRGTRRGAAKRRDEFQN